MRGRMWLGGPAPGAPGTLGQCAVRAPAALPLLSNCARLAPASLEVAVKAHEAGQLEDVIVALLLDLRGDAKARLVDGSRVRQQAWQAGRQAAAGGRAARGDLARQGSCQVDAHSPLQRQRGPPCCTSSKPR